MNVQQAIEYVQTSEKYQSFSKEQPEYYLAHCFCTIDKQGKSPWQIGYYSKKTQKIVSFTADEAIIQHDEDDAFRKEGHVPKLEEKEVSISVEEALAKADAYKEAHHPAEDVTKRIIILQSMKGAPVWNITLITNIFSLINMHVHADTAEVLSTNVDSVLNLGMRT
jgi:hypothetical protein